MKMSLLSNSSDININKSSCSHPCLTMKLVLLVFKQHKTMYYHNRRCRCVLFSFLPMLFQSVFKRLLNPIFVCYVYKSAMLKKTSNHNEMSLSCHRKSFLCNNDICMNKMSANFKTTFHILLYY